MFCHNYHFHVVVKCSRGVWDGALTCISKKKNIVLIEVTCSDDTRFVFVREG